MITNDILSHYGVKGMKWGVRRTQAQLGRVKAAREERKNPTTPEGKIKAQRKAAAKNRRLLEDGEIDALINRLQKEKKLKELVSEDVTPGTRFANALLSDVGKRTLTTAFAGAASYAIYKAAGKAGAEPNQLSPQAFFKPKKK